MRKYLDLFGRLIPLLRDAGSALSLRHLCTSPSMAGERKTIGEEKRPIRNKKMQGLLGLQVVTVHTRSWQASWRKVFTSTQTKQTTCCRPCNTCKICGACDRDVASPSPHPNPSHTGQ